MFLETCSFFLFLRLLFLMIINLDDLKRVYVCVCLELGFK